MVKFNDLKRVTALHGDEIAGAVNRVVRSGWYLNGTETKAFEREYADFIGVSHCVTCANGLDALTLMLRAMLELGYLSPGDEVIVPANTFIATFLAITENGLKPVPVDADPLTMQIDAGKLDETVTNRTRALMLVHLYGRCAFCDEIGDFLKRHPEIHLLEDNAQAHGCMSGSRRTGSLGLAAGHSFYPGKNLGALGDAGAVTTGDPALAEAVRSIANYGAARKYEFRYEGRNSRMDETNAAALRVKLRHLDSDNDKRREIAAIYYDTISNPLVTVPAPVAPDRNVFHLFPLLAENRDSLAAFLSNRGIETIVHYPVPPHMQACYKGADWANGAWPVTERLAAQELSIPIHAAMSHSEAREVADAVNLWKGHC